MKVTLSALAVSVSFLALFSCKKTVEVNIKPGPRPEFSSNLRSIQPGDSIVFTDNSKGTVDTYSWSFEGAENSYSNEKTPAPVHYKKSGRFQVSLTVSGPDGANTITKVDYITVNSVAFTVEWLKTDSVSNGYIFFRGRINGFSNAAVYRAISFVYDYVDPNPGTTSYGFQVYPDSKGEFVVVKQASSSGTNGSTNFYYRILAFSLDYDVYLSEVKQTQFPVVTFNLSSVTQSGQKIHVTGQVSNLSNNGYLYLCMADYPGVPTTNSNLSTSSLINYSGGQISGSTIAYRTLRKQNIRLFGRDNLSGAVGYSDTYAMTFPESFENSSYSYVNNWSTTRFSTTNTKAKTGFYSLGSSEFSGSSIGTSAYATLQIVLESNAIFSFAAAHSNLSGNESFDFYIDGQLANNLNLGTGFAIYSYPVTSGSHTFQWKITKYSNSNYSGRVFLDDITISN